MFHPVTNLKLLEPGNGNEGVVLLKNTAFEKKILKKLSPFKIYTVSLHR